MAEKLRTVQVAKAAGVNVETLRFYERRGILQEPQRRSSGCRVRKLQSMKRALTVLVKSCVGDVSSRECPILDALDDKPSKKAR